MASGKASAPAAAEAAHEGHKSSGKTIVQACKSTCPIEQASERRQGPIEIQWLTERVGQLSVDGVGWRH
jgi:hypothetical protein